MENYNHIRQWLWGNPDSTVETEREGLLTRKNISVENLARAAGLTRHAVYMYINDQRRPSNDAMRRMCNVLGVPHEEGLSQFTPSKRGRPAFKR